nr:immunoglobulin heavy chain junction region [Macaca mulatta]
CARHGRYCGGSECYYPLDQW